MTRTKFSVLAAVLALVVSACGTAASDDGNKLANSPTGGAAGGSTSSSTAPSTSSTASVSDSQDAAPDDPDIDTTPAGDVGTRDNPAAIGELVAVGDWLVRILSTVPDAADRLLSEDDFLDPPQPGNVFFLAELEGTYVGDTSATMWEEFLFNAIGVDDAQYDEFGASCGFIGGQLSSQGAAFPGGTVSGFQCFEVSAEDAEALTIFLEPVFGTGGDDAVFLAGLEGEGSVTGLSFPDVLDTGQDTSVGSRANPVAIGSFAQIGDWFVRFVGVDADATDRVLASGFNESPATGSRYVLADIEIVYVGSESESFWFGLEWTGVGPENVAVDPFEATCGFLPKDLGSAEFFTNGFASGEICLAVQEESLDSFVFFFDAFDSDRQFFAIRDDQGEATDLTVPFMDVELSSERGSRGNEIAVGSSVMVGEWEVAVVGFDEDATELVLSETSFNEPPASGNTFVIVDVEASYLGPDSSNFWSDFSWLILGPDNVAWNTFDAGCGSFPNDFTFSDQVVQGESSEGSFCFEVSIDEVDQLSLIIDDFSTFGPEGRMFFDLR